jgi:protein-tyrosine phosphatase
MKDRDIKTFNLEEEGRWIIRTDPHSHILPAIDDGSRSLAMSFDMARTAVANGVKAIVATPHACHPAAKTKYDAAEVRKMVASFNQQLKSEAIPITVYPGMELLMDESIPGLIESGWALTWADQNRYVLTELGFHECKPCTWEVLDFLLARGLTPIIGHPERYTWIHNDWDSVERLEKLGVFFQINVMSINGLWGEPQRHFALELMRYTSRWIVGTDSHSEHPKFWGIADVREQLIREGIWSGHELTSATT